MAHDIQARIDALHARAATLKVGLEAGEVDEETLAGLKAEMAEEYEAILRDHRATLPADPPRPAPLAGERLVTAIRAFCDAYLAHGR